MKEERLSGIANLTVESEVAKEIDVDEVVNTFAKNAQSARLSQYR